MGFEGVYKAYAMIFILDMGKLTSFNKMAKDYLLEVRKLFAYVLSSERAKYKNGSLLVRELAEERKSSGKTAMLSVNSLGYVLYDSATIDRIQEGLGEELLHALRAKTSVKRIDPAAVNDAWNMYLNSKAVFDDTMPYSAFRQTATAVRDMFKKEVKSLTKGAAELSELLGNVGFKIKPRSVMQYLEHNPDIEKVPTLISYCFGVYLGAKGFPNKNQIVGKIAELRKKSAVKSDTLGKNLESRTSDRHHVMEVVSDAPAKPVIPTHSQERIGELEEQVKRLQAQVMRVRAAGTRYVGIYYLPGDQSPKVAELRGDTWYNDGVEVPANPVSILNIGLERFRKKELIKK